MNPVRRAAPVRAHQQLLTLQPLTRQRDRGKLTPDLAFGLFGMRVRRHPPDRFALLILLFGDATEPVCSHVLT